ncbi:cytochrome c [Roseibacterium beibuensis]|uniref:cytochrome c n=1 Tax=[Roseibacterium] beibuensis TaxID=1193142 RepID=UPI00217DBD39|nr:cytochrome c [Roseibacterium beibuensis]MCS6624671.1 cytochrome c [Roseibacterium beibuensis]
MKRIITAAAIGLTCLAGAAGAQAPQSATADVIKGRQAAMMLSGVAMASIKGSIDAGQPPASQRFATRSLSRWAHAVPGMFPAGSGPEAGVQTNAKAEIWTDRAGFEARAADYAAAADRLAELAASEDAAAFGAQWTTVRATCQACHDAYKVS